MGQPAPEEKERNKALRNDYKLYLKGLMTMFELVTKYKISSSRIHQLGIKKVSR